MLGHILLSVLSLVGTALSAQRNPRDSLISYDSYDYIIVGAGPTGIVAADRLSEAGKKVLLIERGGPSTAETGGTDVPPWASSTNLTRFDIPGVYDSIYSDDNKYWFCDDIEPQAGCLIGGGTAINGILYWYPTDLEYSTSNGWPSGWQSISPYLDKVMARLPSNDNPSSDGQRYLNQVYEVLGAILDKQGYTAITANDNRNSKDRVYSHTGYYIQNAKRTGAMDTYLKTARARPNFTLLTHTKVLSVLRNGGQITGVQTNDTSINGDGVIRLNSTQARVILAAGAFGTARILYQSGIGPSDMLSIAAAKSSVSQYMPPASQYITLPVGVNVRDSPGVRVSFAHPSIDAYTSWGDVFSNPRPADAAQYLSNRSGVLTAPSARANFWRAYSGADGRTRYTQGTCRPGGSVPSSPSYNSSTVFTCTIYVATGMTSVGRIGIDSSLQGVVLTDPWLTDPVDQTALENAISDLISTYQEVPGLQLIVPDSTTSISKHVGGTVSGSNHWAGSTTIGTNSSSSVVDSNTKVWNTENLFIVDAGIYPGMFGANPMGSLLVMAEMAAAKILESSGSTTASSGGSGGSGGAEGPKGHANSAVGKSLRWRRWISMW